jgi:hypothetical protein
MLKILKFSLIFLLVGCGPSAESVQTNYQEYLNKQSNAVGFPKIINFQEKKTLKLIYEIRDKGIPTITYSVDSTNHYHKICNSIGFPLPYSTKYVNPEKYGDGYAMSQGDPNGLYSASVNNGSWILCHNDSNNENEPIFLNAQMALVVVPADFKKPL